MINFKPCTFSKSKSYYQLILIYNFEKNYYTTCSGGAKVFVFSIILTTLSIRSPPWWDPCRNRHFPSKSDSSTFKANIQDWRRNQMLYLQSDYLRSLWANLKECNKQKFSIYAQSDYRTGQSNVQLKIGENINFSFKINLNCKGVGSLLNHLLSPTFELLIEVHCWLAVSAFGTNSNYTIDLIDT